MPADETLFNHIGLCVTDMKRSREFYESGLDFTYWWELRPEDLPQDDAARVMHLDTPLNLHAVYLIRDMFVLELLSYHKDRYDEWRPTSMATPGLTHISVSVANIDAAAERAERFGGTRVPASTHANMVTWIRDPDGQLIELVQHAFRESRPPMPR
jgi:catechol 2,3-dioxygenase-like lactoylglutathione lyase family enzyme